MDNNSITILYYSSSRENDKFEKMIINNILKHCGNIPIVSVTQKPLDFGYNICVGEHNVSYFNQFRQIQKGLEYIKTKWILVCESDIMSPPEYFNFIPEDDNIIVYRYNNVWVNYIGQNLFYKKGISDGAQIVNRQEWLNVINNALSEQPEWDGIKNIPCQFPTKISGKWYGNPLITFKTKNNISKKTKIIKKILPVTKLPYWGTIENFRGIK